MQHVEAIVEYRFSEPSARPASSPASASTASPRPTTSRRTNYGVNAGVNADFPISRRYGVVLEGTYHWTELDFQPRYMTVGGGLRVSF